MCNDPNSLQPPRLLILDGWRSFYTNPYGHLDTTELVDIPLFCFTRRPASRKRIKLTIVNTTTEEHVISTQDVTGQVINSWNK